MRPPGSPKVYRLDPDAAQRWPKKPPPPSRWRRFFRRLKEATQILFVVVAALAVALVANTLRQRPRGPLTVPAPPDDKVDVDLVARHLADAIRIPTISHEQGRDDEEGEVARFREFLEHTYPRLHATLKREAMAGGALLFTWKGSDESLRPALLAAHMDVVPVEAGTEGQWTHPPFEGTIADGFVWGRGAIDDKGSLICVFEAVEALLAKGFRPRRTVYLALGADEEVGGSTARRMAETLGDRGVLLEYVLDEGMAVTQGVFPGLARTVAIIGTAEKGVLSVDLAVETAGGHSSMPPRRTAIGILAGAIDRIERSPMRARLTGPVRGTFESIAPYLPFPKRVFLSNLWLTGSLAGLLARKDATANALLRTTTAPTIFQSGVKDNVLASRARAVVNFRILPGDSVDGVIAHVREAAADNAVVVTKIDRLVSEPSPVSSTDSRAFALLTTTIAQFFPDAVITPGLVVGATDSRHYVPRAENVYRFVPVKLGPEDLARIHGTNERLSVAAISVAVRAYEQILRDGS